MSRSKGPDEVFCGSCGEIIKRDAEICPHCGIRNQETSVNQTVSGSGQDTDDIVARVTTYAPYAAWGFGVLFILSGIAGLLDSPITGIVTALVGVFLLPPTREKLDEWLNENYDIQLTRGMVLGIVLVGLVIAGATAPSTGEASTTGRQSQQAAQGAETAQAVQGIEVRIIYSGSWSGAVGTEGSVKSVSGSGTTTYSIEGDPSIVSANAQKQDDSNGVLTVQIVNNGEVVAEQSTTAEYGVAQVSEQM